MNKGFTLIELLIVVAIIGILAAVGAVVIPNILKNTKITAVKAQHTEIVKYLSAEFLKCDLGHSTILNGKEKCPASDLKATLKASAADVLSETMKNVYLGSGTSAFFDAGQKGSVRPCETHSGKSMGCHVFEWALWNYGKKDDKRFIIRSYYQDDGDITDNDSNPDIIVTFINSE